MLIPQSPLITFVEAQGLFVQSLQRLSPWLRDLSRCITNGALVSSWDLGGFNLSEAKANIVRQQRFPKKGLICSRLLGHIKKTSI